MRKEDGACRLLHQPDNSGQYGGSNTRNKSCGEDPEMCPGNPKETLSDRQPDYKNYKIKLLISDPGLFLMIFNKPALNAKLFVFHA